MWTGSRYLLGLKRQFFQESAFQPTRMIRIPTQSIISESVVAIIPEIRQAIIKLVGSKSFEGFCLVYMIEVLSKMWHRQCFVAGSTEDFQRNNKKRTYHFGRYRKQRKEIFNAKIILSLGIYVTKHHSYTRSQSWSFNCHNDKDILTSGFFPKLHFFSFENQILWVAGTLRTGRSRFSAVVGAHRGHCSFLKSLKCP